MGRMGQINITVGLVFESYHKTVGKPPGFSLDADICAPFKIMNRVNLTRKRGKDIFNFFELSGSSTFFELKQNNVA
jgi:hypothetical protein